MGDQSNISHSSYQYRRANNTYWHLHIPDLPLKQMRAQLEEKGYYVHKSAGGEALRHAMARSMRALPPFLHLKNAELRELIKVRGIDATGVTEGKRQGARGELIDLLERADAHPKFGKFLRLPPEMRNRVYDYYFSDFDEQPLRAPKQPPLTLTCSTIRKETLQIFYSRCTFEIVLTDRYRHGIGWFPVLQAPQVYRLQLLIPDLDYRFFSSVTNGNFAQIRKLNLKVCTEDYSDKECTVIFAAGIRISEEADMSRVCLEQGETNPSAVNAHKQVEDLLRKLAQSRGKMSLRRNDVLRLRRAIEDGYH